MNDLVGGPYGVRPLTSTELSSLNESLPGHFGFYSKCKYFVVPHPDSRQEVLGRQIVSEIKQSLRDGRYKEWMSKVKSLKIISDKCNLSEIEEPDEVPEGPATRGRQRVSWCAPHEPPYSVVSHRLNCSGLFDILSSGEICNDLDEGGLPRFRNNSYIINLDSNELNHYVGYRVVKSYYFDEEFDCLPNW